MEKTHITLLPPKGNSRESFLIKNGSDDVRVYRPVILDEGKDIYAYCEPHLVGISKIECNVRVVARKAGFNVLYDGKTVKVQVSFFFFFCWYLLVTSYNIGVYTKKKNKNSLINA